MLIRLLRWEGVSTKVAFFVFASCLLSSSQPSLCSFVVYQSLPIHVHLRDYEVISSQLRYRVHASIFICSSIAPLLQCCNAIVQ